MTNQGLQPACKSHSLTFWYHQTGTPAKAGVPSTITRKIGNQLAWLTGTCWMPASNQPP